METRTPPRFAALAYRRRASSSVSLPVNHRVRARAPSLRSSHRRANASKRRLSRARVDTHRDADESRQSHARQPRARDDDDDEDRERENRREDARVSRYRPGEGIERGRAIHLVRSRRRGPVRPRAPRDRLGSFGAKRNDSRGTRRNRRRREDDSIRARARSVAFRAHRRTVVLQHNPRFLNTRRRASASRL